MLYGIHTGLSISKVDLYYIKSGEAYALKQDNYSFNVPGFNIAVSADIRLGRSFRLRVMPGMTLFGRDWKPDNVAVLPYTPSGYKVESVCMNFPVDVKYIPFRMGMFCPFLSGGLGYSIDFASIRASNEKILRLNTSDFRYLLGVGLDCNTKMLKIGLEFKAGFDLSAPSTSADKRPNAFYFQNSPTFVIGLNFQA